MKIEHKTIGTLEVNVDGWLPKIFVAGFLVLGVDGCANRFGGPDAVDIAKGTGGVLWEMAKKAYDGLGNLSGTDDGGSGGAPTMVYPPVSGSDGVTSLAAEPTPTPHNCDTRVASGETLSLIAADPLRNPHGLSVSQIAQMSGLPNVNSVIQVGQCIDTSPNPTPVPGK